MVKKLQIILIIVFSLMGIILAGTLTVAKYSNNISAICGDEQGSSCNIVQNSEYSYLINIKDDKGVSEFQVPLSLAGMFFYTVLLILSIILLKHFTTKELKNLKYFMFLVGLTGIGFSAFYTWIQAYKIEAFCTYCLFSAFDSVVLFILIISVVFDDKVSINKVLRRKRKGKNTESAN